MPMTPQQIRDKVFTATRFRAGYSEQEVDDFLEEVERELGRLMSENAELRRQLEQRGETPVVTGQPAPEPVAASEPVEVHPIPDAHDAAAGAATAAAGAEAALPPDTEAEQLLRRTLVLAQRTAEEAIREARKDADKLRADAQAHFEQQIGQVEHDRHELEQQVDQLRAFEREYRTRLRAYLELQLRELDAPGSQGQVEGAPSRPPIGPGTSPAGHAPGGPAGTAPGGPAGPEAGSPLTYSPPSESASGADSGAASNSAEDSAAEDGEGEQSGSAAPTAPSAPSTPTEG
jgi:DivIVA domain-containing protein